MNSLDKVSDVELASAFKERFRIPDGGLIRSSQDAVNHLATYLGGELSREAFYVVFLSGRNQVIATEKMFEGTLTSSAVYPREIVKRVLELNAAAVILAHNHPSGNTNPSSDDRAITQKIVTALRESIEAAVHDHIILTPGGGHTSMADLGLL
jgi:DNA repair protein RadC